MSAAEFSVLWLSVRVALAATLLCAPLAVATAWLLARREFAGKTLIDAAVGLPLVLPPVVTGYLLLAVFGRKGLFGAPLEEWLGVQIPFTTAAAAIAAAVMAFPLFVRAVRLSIEAVDPRLEEAARSLGASRVRSFTSVTLPLAAPGLLAGALLGFARALGEFGATITFAGSIAGETRTIPLAIYALTQTPGGEAAAARLVVLSVVVSVAALVVGETLARRMRKRTAATREAR